MTVTNILDMPMEDVMKLNKKELTKLTTTLASAANKRYRTLKRLSNTQDVYSPAYESMLKSGGAISVKDKNLNEVRREFVRARDFLEKRTSTGRGARNFMKEMEFNIEMASQGKYGRFKGNTKERDKAFKRFKRRMSNAELKDFFRNYDRMKELKGLESAWQNVPSDIMMKILLETTRQNAGLSAEEILAKATENARKESEEAYNYMRAERDADKSEDVFSSEGWV